MGVVTVGSELLDTDYGLLWEEAGGSLIYVMYEGRK
jgi:hypothetical protein